jgi:5-methyltetrahydrofolate--homocysteine methyltransferase
MNRYKEDIEEAKERLKAWWDHEIIDRPCISYFCPKPDAYFKGIYDLWYLAKHWDDFEGIANDYEEKSEALIFGAETIPWFWPNYGPGIMASVFGVTPKFESETVWFNKPIAPDEIVSHLENMELNRNNEWYDRLIRCHGYLAKNLGKDFSIAMTDLGGILDVLSSFLGPTKLILTMKRNPEIIDESCAIILEKTMKVYDSLQSIIEKYSDGCNSWIPLWCHKRYYPIQCDFAAMLSPKYFERFAMPYIKEQAEQLDYSVYHMDGPRQIPHLDSLLAEPAITAIQWVPGAGDESAISEKWKPLYKKIQGAGKNLIVDNPLEVPLNAAKLYKDLDGRGLFMILAFISKIQAKFYLPDFLGGNYGEGDFRRFKRQYKKEIKQKNKI